MKIIKTKRAWLFPLFFLGAFGTLSVFPETVMNEENGFLWSYDTKTGFLSINGTGVLNATLAIEYQPQAIKIQIGEGVTSIATNAFHYCKNLLEISLPSTIETIEDNVFKNNMIGTIRCNREEPPIIYENTFSSEKEVCIIYVPDGSRKLYAKAPYWKDFDNIYQGQQQPELISGQCGDGVEYQLQPGEWELTISGTAMMEDFLYDSSPWKKYAPYINKVTIQDGVESIGDNSFSRLKRLHQVNIPTSIKSIGKHAFELCSLTTISIPGSVREIGDNAFSFCPLTEIAFSEGLQSIGDGAFENCLSIDKIVLPSTLQTIGKRAFMYAPITSVIIPEACTSIGEEAFRQCKELKEVVLSNNLRVISDYTFSNCIQLTTVSIPSLLERIGNYAFQSTCIQEICLPQTIKSIGRYAFADCALLEVCSLPENITVIEDGTFYGCKALATIELPLSLNKIGSSAFANSGLTGIVIPDGVTDFGSNLFSGCSSIKDPIYNEKIFIYLPNGFDNYTVPSSIERLNASCFSDCKTLESIDIKDVRYIGDYVFSGCSSLIEIVLPNQLESIGEGAFSGCAELNGTIDLSSYKISKIPNSLFEGCKKLDVVLLPIELSELGYSCFRNCEELEKIQMPEKLSKICPNAFNGCESLEGIELPEGVTFIGQEAFSNCINLKELEIKEGVTRLNELVFNNCERLHKVILPETVEEIYLQSFTNCSKLDTLLMKKETAPKILDSVFDSSVWGFQWDFSKDYWEELNLPFNTCIICIPVNAKKAWINESDNYYYLMEYKFRYGEFFESFSGECGAKGDSLTWTLDTKTGKLSIQGEGNMCAFNWNTIPWRKRHYAIQSVEIGEGVKSIAESAFMGDCFLKEVALPESLTKIGQMAFAECSQLKSIRLPNAIRDIPMGLFERCEQLEEVVIPDSIESIGVEAFGSCYSLREIVIPRTVRSIGQFAFSSCSSLQTIYSHLLSPIPVDNLCNSPNKHCKVYVHVGTIEQYKRSTGWDAFEDYEEKYADVNLVSDESGAVYGQGEYEIGDQVIVSAVPNEKYLFIGWSNGVTDNPYSLIVNDDVTLEAFFKADTHIMTFYVDGEAYVTYELFEGDKIEIPNNPEKEGYTFSGWSEIPEIMPSHDVTVTGSFTINSYKLTYMIGDEVYRVVEYEFGATITPEPKPEGDYIRFEWVDLPETMPASDVTVYAEYETGIDFAILPQCIICIYNVEGIQMNELQKGVNIVVMSDGTTRIVYVK